MEFLNDIYCAPFDRFLEFVPDKSIQLVFTSPPYEDMVVYRNSDMSVLHNGLTGQDWIDEFWHKLFGSLHDKLKDDGVIGVVVNDKRKERAVQVTVHRAVVQMVDKGWRLVEEIPWLKTCAVPKSPEYSLQDWWERILLFSKQKEFKYYPSRIRGAYSEAALRRYGVGGATRMIGESPTRQHTKGEHPATGRDSVVTINPEGKLMPNALMVAPDVGRKASHPARFPRKLARWAIVLCTDKDDTVFDPMCGSGTTCIEAKASGRRYIGTDIGREYVEQARKEVEDTFYQETMWSKDSVGVEI